MSFSKSIIDEQSESLLPAKPTKKSDSSSGSNETETTDDECGETFEDAVTDFAHFDRSKEQELTGGHPVWKSREQQRAKPFAESTKQKFDPTTVRYLAGELHGSSSGSCSSKVSSGASSADLGCVVEYTYDDFGNVDYVDVDFNDVIDERHIVKIMNKLRLNHHSSVSCEGDNTLFKCKKLFERDYFCETIENSSGNLCKNYPARLIIPVARKSKVLDTERIDEVEFDLKQYHSRVKASVSSRLLTRFVVPVILVDRKFICRSGSLTVRKTAVFETARKNQPAKSLQVASCVVQQITRKLATSVSDLMNRSYKAASQLFVPNSIKKLRNVDAEIMRDLNIQHVCDLMLQDRKMFKQAIRLSSSEKINEATYYDFLIEQMPYPGCKFFRKYCEANYDPKGFLFNWNDSEINTEIKFSENPYDIFPDTDWDKYKEWDMVVLTKNYMKMLLFYLAKDCGGLLVHCISGWDRTPLFISMLRVSLWADGVIHESLNCRDMAFLTLAYDWYLFGHDLPRRLREKKEIMHFCFKFLPYISTDEFSLTRLFSELSPELKNGRKLPEFEHGKRAVINELSEYVLKTYHELITKKLK